MTIEDQEDERVNPLSPGEREIFEELKRHYESIENPNTRAALLYLAIMAAHMESAAAIELIEKYLPSAR